MSNLTVDPHGPGKAYWGPQPIPSGAQLIGVLRADQPYRQGALIKLASGMYVQGNAGCVRTLPQSEVRLALLQA